VFGLTMAGDDLADDGNLLFLGKRPRDEDDDGEFELIIFIVERPGRYRNRGPKSSKALLSAWFLTCQDLHAPHCLSIALLRRGIINEAHPPGLPHPAG